MHVPYASPSATQSLIDVPAGPDVGGGAEPYRQSERASIYKAYVDRLVSEGRAYPCFCSDEELEAMKADAEAKKLPPIYRCAWWCWCVGVERAGCAVPCCAVWWNGEGCCGETSAHEALRAVERQQQLGGLCACMAVHKHVQTTDTCWHYCCCCCCFVCVSCRGKWSSASKEEVEAEMAKGTPYCYRFRVPPNKEVRHCSTPSACLDICACVCDCLLLTPYSTVHGSWCSA
jgi:hypothetical protein